MEQPSRREAEWDGAEVDPFAEGRKAGASSVIPYVFAGIVLVIAFALAGNYMGRNAAARIALPEAQWVETPNPSTATALVSKASLADLNFAVAPVGRGQAVTITTKGDFLVDDTIMNEPVGERGDLQPRLARTPPTWKMENTWKLGRGEKLRLLAQHKLRVAETDCLTRAVYFESLGESDLGQLAVARVILNRVKDPKYPKTICGVVYQGAEKPGACQFSFACDGRPDVPRSASGWEHAKQIAARALAGDQSIKIMSAATYYHADYVKPRWSNNFRRLIKIGRHIFYADS